MEIKKMYNTKKFTDIYGSLNDFINDYNTIGIPKTIKDESASTLYFLLYGKFGNSPIANFDENQFKYKLFSTVFMYGPTWEKRLDIQSKLRELNDTELFTGTKSIFNHAYNPGEVASESTSSTTNQPELQYVNDQNVANVTKSKMDAYMQLYALLETDVTEEFLSQFNKCFKQFVRPGAYLYESEE